MYTLVLSRLGSIFISPKLACLTQAFSLVSLLCTPSPDLRVSQAWVPWFTEVIIDIHFTPYPMRRVVRSEPSGGHDQ